MTKDNIEKLRKDIDHLTTKIEYLRSTNVKKEWLLDLDKLIEKLPT